LYAYLGRFVIDNCRYDILLYAAILPSKSFFEKNLFLLFWNNKTDHDVFSVNNTNELFGSTYIDDLEIQKMGF